MSKPVPLPPPADLDLDPEKFPDWRPGQAAAIWRALNSEKRFVALVLPTGSGKSVSAVALHTLMGSRSVYLTSTRGLQDQLERDFSQHPGLFDLRGMANYPCRQLLGMYRGNCDQGPCLEGEFCEYREAGCHFFDRQRQAEWEDLTSTNYAYWLSRTVAGNAPGLGDRDLLICDEAHDAPGTLAAALRIEFKEQEIQLPRASEIAPLDAPEAGWDWERWRDWGRAALDAWTQRLAEVKGARAKRETRQVVEKLRRLANTREEEHWVSSRTDYGWAFEPVWPGQMAEHLLFRGIPKIILVSATLNRKTLEYLGLTPGDYEFIEGRSYFPVASRLVTHVPTIRVTWKTKPDEMLQWVHRIDQIIGQRLDRKGLVHTVSYARARYLQEHSEHRDIMLLPDSRTTRKVVEEFKQCAAPRVLVSPALTTGWDFEGDTCRYQIIGKVPFPDGRDPITQARAEDDPDYLNFLTMAELVQMAGRAVRSAEDWAESLVIDDNVGWFVMRNQKFAPQWFMESYRKADDGVIPTPPKLNPQR